MSLNPWLIILMAIISGLLTAHFAMRKGRQPLPWFAVGFFTGWLVGLVIVYLMPPTGFGAAKEPVAAQRPTAPPPPPSGWYMLDEQWQQRGPMSFDEVTAALRLHSAPDEALLWHPSLTQWTAPSDLPALRPDRS